MAKTIKYTMEHSKAKLCFVGKLNRGPCEQTQKVVLEGLKCILFPLCPADLTYNVQHVGIPMGVILVFGNMIVPTHGFIATFIVTSKDRYLLGYSLTCESAYFGVVILSGQHCWVTSLQQTAY